MRLTMGCLWRCTNFTVLHLEEGNGTEIMCVLGFVNKDREGLNVIYLFRCWHRILYERLKYCSKVQSHLCQNIPSINQPTSQITG